MKELVDKLLEEMSEEEIRVLCNTPFESWVYWIGPSIIEELDRRKRARLPWWRRIGK